MNRSALSNRGTKISYTIVLPFAEFHASADEGSYLQVGMDIAVVLDKNESVIILDKSAKKYLGLSKPYFILFIIAFLGFNAYMYHLCQTNQTHLLRFRPTLIVTNIFLVLATILSIATYKVTSSAKAFLLSVSAMRSCGRRGPEMLGTTLARSSSSVSVNIGSGVASVRNMPCSLA